MANTTLLKSLFQIFFWKTNPVICQLMSINMFILICHFLKHENAIVKGISHKPCLNHRLYPIYHRFMEAVWYSPLDLSNKKKVNFRFIYRKEDNSKAFLHTCFEAISQPLSFITEGFRTPQRLTSTFKQSFYTNNLLVIKVS